MSSDPLLLTRNIQGRRREDTPLGGLPQDIRAGDYWKILNDNGTPKHVEHGGNLTGTAWMVVVPMAVPDPLEDLSPYTLGRLERHTVREHEDGSITVAPGDGSSNSILVTGARGRTWHGYIERGYFRES